MNGLMVGQLSRRVTLLVGAVFIAPLGIGHVASAHSVTAGVSSLTAQLDATEIAMQHVTIRATKPFEAVRAALEAAIPPLDHSYEELLRSGNVTEARDRLEGLAPLSIFSIRDHGSLLQVTGSRHKAIQYDIGNPLTASRMTRHVLSAALYAPIRVLLREATDGSAAFEYDRPATSFGQFGDKDVDAVAGELDRRLRDTLLAAAS